MYCVGKLTLTKFCRILVTIMLGKSAVDSRGSYCISLHGNLQLEQKSCRILPRNNQQSAVQMRHKQSAYT